ncbi:thioredoxin family protein [Aequorivita sp. F47161]|uniref:Thioredoxin family protein n=1 Tax=Aequorivita vitellina TaxID=2874475 RepID=A0A9X1TZC2_9FLAO|nr:thioredoxin family protein [Aequorivita vitellina]MCG2417934.1 thioredoxin family protein [Aequorivita vitellina]
MFKKLLLLLVFTVLLSCKSKDENVVKTTWIGGQIINPTLDYIVFSRGNEILDTVKLDSNNFFLYKTDKIKAGLYNLKHNETQVFFIEPGDSLLLHVNTLDFDESLAYSGRGGEQNNLLMYLYLTNETENLKLQNWYGLSSKEFTHKIDSLKQLKIKEYKDFIAKNEVVESFKNAVMANINYDYYIKKERYAAANRNRIAEFDENYFDYRKKINFELEEFKFYYPYYRFMNRYFENLVFSEYKSDVPINRNSYDFNYRRIKLIDSLVTSDSLRNSLLRSNAMFYFLNAKNAAEEQQFFDEFAKMNSDKKHVEEVRKMYNITVKLNPGNTVPNVALVNTDNTLKDLHSIIKAPTVVYFWSGKSPSNYKNIHNRAAELKSKYPEYDFLGINTDTHYKKWRQTINRNGYNPLYEFQIENLNEAEKKLLLKYMNSALILDKDGKILEGKINLFNTNFEQLLLGFLNR